MNKNKINIVKLKYSLGIIISSLILILILLFSFNSINLENKKINAYDNAQYDFLITNLANEDRVDEIKSDDNVISTTSFYNFKLKPNSGSLSDFLFTEDIDNLNKTFYNEDTLLKGEYKKDSAIIDEKFAKTYKLKIGDSIEFDLLGYRNTIEVSGIILSTELGGFTNGIALLEWTDTYESKLDKPIDHDLMFINVTNQDKLRNYLSTNKMSFIERTSELKAVKNISEPLIKNTFISIVIYSAVLLVVKTVLVLGLFISDSNKIKVFVKENNKDVINVYKFYGLKMEMVSLIVLLIAITVFKLIMFINQVFLITLGVVVVYSLVSAALYYLISYKFTTDLKVATNKVTKEEQEKKEESKNNKEDVSKTNKVSEINKTPSKNEKNK